MVSFGPDGKHPVARLRFAVERQRYYTTTLHTTSGSILLHTIARKDDLVIQLDGHRGKFIPLSSPPPQQDER